MVNKPKKQRVPKARTMPQPRKLPTMNEVPLKLETTFEDALMVIAQAADKPIKESSKKKKDSK